QGSREEETGGDESPGAHVLGFFLDPDGVFGGGIGREQRSQDVCREGVELLESDDRGVGGFALGSFGLEVVEDFAAAEEETLDLEEVRSLRIINDGLEADARGAGGRMTLPHRTIAGQSVERREARRETPEALGSEEDQRSCPRGEDLPAH